MFITRVIISVTYIDDVIDQILKIINQPSTNNIPYQIFNIGSSRPIHLLKFIKPIKYLGKKAKLNFVSSRRCYKNTCKY